MTTPLRAQVALLDSFDPLDVIAPFEVLHAAGVISSGALNVELASAEGPREVTSGIGGVALRATAELDPTCDLIIVPGVAGPIEDPDDVGIATVPVLLARAAETALPGVAYGALTTAGTTVAAVCGGSLVLAMAGLLEGRHVVTHHEGMDVLEAAGAVPVQARVVDDGNLISGGGVTSGLDVGLYLVERLLGPQIAIAVERLFEYERRGTVWRGARDPGVDASAAAVRREPAPAPA
jgi:transcriptional regulator GlxA family with amidase domain